MQVLIDNGNGQGNVDYTTYLCFSSTLMLRRRLNEPSLFRFRLLLPQGAAGSPGLLARVEVSDTVVGTLFTGYVISAPLQTIAGVGETGVMFALEVEAWSDEVLLDLGAATANATLLSASAQENWQLLSAFSASAALPLVVAPSVAPVRGDIEVGQRWSELAGQMAASSRAAYKAVNRSVAVNAIGSTTHVVQASDPRLQFESPGLKDLRWLASDVTVCGQEEPAAYVTEIFEGDGATTSFDLSMKPFSPSAKERVNIVDLFQGTTLNGAIWSLHDAGSHVALSASGLSCYGGSGRDAEATVSSLQAVELGGLITLEGDGIQINAASTGLIVGFYSQAVNATNCIAAFQISSVVGQATVAANVGGASPGATLNLLTGHLYTFRLRLSCDEVERVHQSYVCLGQGGVVSFGGDAVASGGRLEMEVQDVTGGAPLSPVVLYSGLIPMVPPTGVIGLVNSGNLSCSIKSVRCLQMGPTNISILAPSGASTPQIIAAEGNGGACHITTTGKLTFYPAATPASGSLIYTSYRSEEMAVARRSAGAASGLPVVTWIGSVVRPKTWSRVDCDNAAAALLASAAASSVAIKGTYEASWSSTSADFWPGDSLEILGGVSTVPAVIREVTLTWMDASPAVVRYEVAFANDWAEGVSIALSNAVPATTQIPSGPTGIGTALTSLSSLTATLIAGATLSVQAGVCPPVNGGFEVRRRDHAFGPGDDSDLVLRTAAQNFTIPRLAAVEQYYVRMYDGATTPNYSLFSAAILLNVPL